MKTPTKSLFAISLVLFCNFQAFGQITYEYYKNPEKIGSTNPRATEYFIKSFEFIMQWGSQDTDSAIYYMQKAIQEDSLYAIAYASLGHLIKFRGYDGTVIPVDSIARLTDKALSINPQCADAYTLQSWVYTMNGQVLDAIDACKKAVEAEPDHREAWFWLAVRYAQIPDKIDSAIFYFNKTIEIDPLFGQPHQKLGWIYLDQKPDYAKSVYHFRRMIYLYEEVEPKDERMIVGYQGLGEALVKSKEYDDAIDTLNMLLNELESSGLLWTDQLRSWGHTALAEAYMGKAEEEVERFIALNLSILEKHPGDMGSIQTIITDINSLEGKYDDYDQKDTLQQIREPFFNEIFSHDSVESYIVTQTIFSQYELMAKDKEYEKDRELMEAHIDRYAGRSDITSIIYYILAANSMKLEDPEQAIRHLELGVDDGLPIEWIEYSPTFEGLKDNPKYKKLLEQMN